jgi:CHASE2 domain-containing sensor protein
VVAFDIAFSSAGPEDATLRRAMERAQTLGTRVVIGLTRWTPDGQPAISETLRPAISGFGSLCVRTRNGAVRFAPLALDPSVRNERIPSFAASTFAAAGGRELEIVALDHRRATVEVDLGGQPRAGRTFEAVRIAEADAGCPLASEGDIEALMALELNAPPADARPYLKYEAILTQAPEELSEAVGGRLVLLGRDTPEERFPVRYALSPDTRLGVELHADALDTLLRGRLVHPASLDLRALLLAPWALVGVGLARRGGRSGVGGLVAAAAAIGALAVALHLAFGIVMRPSYALLALLLSYAVIRTARRRGIQHAR